MIEHDEAVRWVMPAETAPQDRLWMAFPTEGHDESVFGAWSAVANAASAFEPVTMLVTEECAPTARRLLSAEVTLEIAELDDAWLRDSGATFVIGPDGELGAVDWVFNGWGAQSWAQWELDRQVGRTLATLADATIVSSALVNEGGAILVDGLGTAIITETVQLDPFRNPYADKGRVEAELRRTLGVSTVIWLKRGLTRDYEPSGTRGHVDMMAAIPAPGVILVHEQLSPEHPDSDVSRQVIATLSDSVDAEGRAWDIRRLPAPRQLRDERGFVDWNYANHAVVNGGVISCGYDDPMDAAAREVLADAYPGREVVMVDARPILDLGGGVHCITQQQPSRPEGAAHGHR
jgi:agmatine deiminase